MRRPQADVVVVQGDHPDRAGREGVPVAAELSRAVVRYLETGLVRRVALRAVTDLILMIASGRHPRPVGGRAGVVVKEGLPGLDRRVADIGVAEVAVEQVEQGIQALDGRDGVARVRRVRAKAQADRRGDRLVAEAGEPEAARAAARTGA